MPRGQKANAQPGILPVVRTWELWQGEEGNSFFPEDNEQARRMARDQGYICTWTTTAPGGNDAMRRLYEHLGLGAYEPMLRPDGTPYPEDEDDDYRPA